MPKEAVSDMRVDVIGVVESLFGELFLSDRPLLMHASKLGTGRVIR